MVLLGLGVGGIAVATREAPAAVLFPPPPSERAEVYVERGDALLADGRWSDALAAYDTAVGLDAASEAAHVGAAMTLVFTHRYAAATERADAAIALAPRSSVAHAVLALARNWRGETAQALAAAGKAVQLDGASAWAHAYVAEALVDQYKLPEADRALARARALDAADAEVRRVSGYLSETRQDYTAAVEEYDAALERRPGWAHLHIARGHALRVLQRFEEAVAAFERAAELAPPTRGRRRGWAEWRLTRRSTRRPSSTSSVPWLSIPRTPPASASLR
jgi:tetratricopeptide (TPR) repeat protein